jgi:hypothetical protein
MTEKYRLQGLTVSLSEASTKSTKR